MPKRILAKIADIVLGILVAIYIVLEELVWENIAEPIYRFIHSLVILQRVELFIVRLDRHILLVIFLALFIQVELLGLFALKLIGTGKVIAGTALYAGKIPVAAFTFWLFRVAQEQLMTFVWFKKSYDLTIWIIDGIKSSSIYLRIVARIKTVKEWFKSRLSLPRFYIKKLINILTSWTDLNKIR